MVFILTLICTQMTTVWAEKDTVEVGREPVRAYLDSMGTTENAYNTSMDNNGIITGTYHSASAVSGFWSALYLIYDTSQTYWWNTTTSQFYWTTPNSLSSTETYDRYQTQGALYYDWAGRLANPTLNPERKTGWYFDSNVAPPGASFVGAKKEIVVESVTPTSVYTTVKVYLTKDTSLPIENRAYHLAVWRPQELRYVPSERRAYILLGAIGTTNDFWWDGYQPLMAEISFSPYVDTKIPDPASTPVTVATPNNTGEIAGITKTTTKQIGNSVDNTPTGYNIKGARTGQTLVYASGAATNIPYRYTALRDITNLSSVITGNTYDKLGTGSIKWSVTDYEADTTIFTERIIVTTSGSPDIFIYFPGTNNIYDNRWMSSTTSADANRRMGLDIQASSTFNGKYDLASFIGGSKERFDTVTKTGGTAVTNSRITNWQNANTDSTGVPVTSQAFAEGDHATVLTGIGGPKYMRYDNDQPTITTITPNDDWTDITGHDATDALSGLETTSGGVFYKLVDKDATVGTTTPVDGSDWTNLNAYTKPLEPGDYDIWVYAKDNATNRSPAKKLGTFAAKDTFIRLEKRVASDKGDADDVFLISLSESSNLLTSVALKKGETSGELTLDMKGVTSRDIKISEITPMDYAAGFTLSVIDNADNSVTPVSGSTVTINLGDDVTIVVENTFEPTGYFKAKDFVKNIFKK